MSKKWTIEITLLLTVYFLILGVIFSTAAEEQQRVSATTLAVENGNLTEMPSDKIGTNEEKYELLYKGSVVCYVLSVVIGGICVGAFIKNRKQK